MGNFKFALTSTFSGFNPAQLIASSSMQIQPLLLEHSLLLYKFVIQALFISSSFKMLFSRSSSSARTCDFQSQRFSCSGASQLARCDVNIRCDLSVSCLVAINERCSTCDAPNSNRDIWGWRCSWLIKIQLLIARTGHWSSSPLTAIYRTPVLI